MSRRLDTGVLLILFALIAVYSHIGTEWETVATKHYWSRGFYYGGYALQYLPGRTGLREIHTESQANISNLAPLTETAPYPWPVPVNGFPGTERLVGPFLVTLVLRASRWTMNAVTAFWTVNVLLWMAATVLSYRVAGILFRDRWSPLFAATLVAAYPVFSLTVGSIKLQHLGVVYLLAGILAFETRIRGQGIVTQFVSLLAFIWIGLFASGGWVFFAAYVMLRLPSVAGRERWILAASLLLALGLAKAGVAALTDLYELPSIERDLRVSYVKILGDSWQWLATWATGGDVTSHRLFNYEGDRLFSLFLPILARAFFHGHWLVAAVAVAAGWWSRPARMLVLMAVPLFFAGHAGTMLTGWLWHYGYLSAPAGVLLILSASRGLAMLAEDGRWVPRLTAAVLVVLILWPWFDLKTQVGLYLSGPAGTYQADTYVYVEGDPVARQY
jgi:hypothetical protein